MKNQYNYNLGELIDSGVSFSEFIHTLENYKNTLLNDGYSLENHVMRFGDDDNKVINQKEFIIVICDELNHFIGEIDINNYDFKTIVYLLNHLSYMKCGFESKGINVDKTIVSTIRVKNSVFLKIFC